MTKSQYRATYVATLTTDPPAAQRLSAYLAELLDPAVAVCAAFEGPDGRWQVTHRGLPVYSYAHEAPEQVLCDDVDGWFVVRLR